MQKIQILAFLLFLTTIFFFGSCENKEAEKPDFSALECGYQYKHHIQNEGPKPQVGEIAYYYFILKADDSLMMDGREADMVSKTQIPTPLKDPCLKVSPTLSALKLMSVGDSVTVIVPVDSIPELPPGFENVENFYYDLVLIDIKTKEENTLIVEEEKKANNARTEEVNVFSNQILKDYQSGKLADKLVEKPSGLKYYIHDEGKDALLEEGETVQVRYHAMFSDGKSFDSTFLTGSNYPIKIGARSVTAGFDEALTYFKRGTKAVLFVPFVLGYGAEGVPGFIPPSADLVYYIEVIK